MRVKSEEKRQAILDIAHKVFTELGFSQTSMAQIARKVGGSKATLYNYFDSKEAIFAAVMESSTERISEAFVNLPVEKPIRTTLIEFGCNYLSSILTPGLSAIYKMALSEADHSEISRHFYINGPQKGWGKISQYLLLQKENNQIKFEDEWIAALQLKALIEAELLEPYLLNVIARPNEDRIQAVVKRGVDVFLAIYSPNS